MAYKDFKIYKSNFQYIFVLFRYMGKVSNIFDYELKHYLCMVNKIFCDFLHCTEFISLLCIRKQNSCLCYSEMS